MATLLALHGRSMCFQFSVSYTCKIKNKIKSWIGQSSQPATVDGEDETTAGQVARANDMWARRSAVDGKPCRAVLVRPGRPFTYPGNKGAKLQNC